MLDIGTNFALLSSIARNTFTWKLLLYSSGKDLEMGKAPQTSWAILETTMWIWSPNSSCRLGTWLKCWSQQMWPSIWNSREWMGAMSSTRAGWRKCRPRIMRHCALPSLVYSRREGLATSSCEFDLCTMHSAQNGRSCTAILVFSWISW